MANVNETKGKSKAGEFSEKPSANAPAAMVPAPSGRTSQIQKMADAGYEATDRYAKELGTEGSAATLIDHDELDNLINVPFTIVEKTVRQGDYGPYLSLVCVLQTDDLVVFNTGGSKLETGSFSGIPGQLDGIEITPDKPHRVPSGLRRSDYVNRHTNTPSVTYYLNYGDAKDALFARMKAKTKRPRLGTNGSPKPAA